MRGVSEPVSYGGPGPGPPPPLGVGVGVGPAAQVAQLHVVEQTGLDDLGDVVVVGEQDGVVRLVVDGVPWQAGVVGRPGEPRRQSCADLKTKPATLHEVLAAGPTA